MSSHVLPQRFVNTPTVGEVYKKEHPEAVVDIAEDDIEKLSEEYNQADRTGTEGYYKLLFEHIQQAHNGTPYHVAGNEGIIAWVKDMVGGFIEAIKKFFKWIWSWFGGKEEIAKKKANTLDIRLKEKGVKTGDIPYPKSYTDLWGKPTKVPQSLDWMNGELDKFNKAIDQAKKHKAEFKTFAEGVERTLTSGKSPFISQLKGDLDKQVQAYGKAVQTAFGSKDGQWTPWVGISLYNVSKDGKVSVSINNKILPQKSTQPTFKTNVTQVENLRKKLKACQVKWSEYVKECASLEQVSVKQMTKSMEWASSVDLVNQKDAQAIISKIKKTASDLMVTIKAEDNMFADMIISGFNILDAAIEGGNTPASKGVKDAA